MLVMNNSRTLLSGLDLTRLVTAVESMNHELALVPGESFTNATQTPLSALGESWRHLKSLLELGPEPSLRECPSCEQLCMLEATRCGHCWTPLPSLDKPVARD